MPRPAAKKNRLVARNGTNSTDQNAARTKNGTHEVDPHIGNKTATAHDRGMTGQVDQQADTHESPDRDAGRVISSSQMSDGPVPKSWTPVAQTIEQDHAIGSSPTGERLATGSRPPSRARGYSSTMSLAGRKGDASSRGTPAFETSILSNFRRRPRQPSILQMMQADDGSSNLDDDDDFLGAMTPQDESTPLNRSRGKSSIFQSAATPSHTLSSPTVNGPKKRRRSAEELQEPQSQSNTSSIVKGTPNASPTPEQRDNELSAPDGLQELSGSQRKRGEFEIKGKEREQGGREVEGDEEEREGEATSLTIAPPMSSSPQLSPAVSAPLNNKYSPYATTKRKKRPTTQVNQKTSDRSTGLATESIQRKLLPRRRQRRHIDAAGFEIPSDSDSDHHELRPDDDELSYLPSRKPTQSRAARGTSSKPLNTTQGRSRSVNQGKNQKKGRPDFSAKSKRPNPGTRRTYSSKPQEDNDLDNRNQAIGSSSPLSSPLDSDAFHSDSSSPSNLNPAGNNTSQELQLQAKKFAEVDQWQMEFEDVTVPASQDSAMG